MYEGTRLFWVSEKGISTNPTKQKKIPNTRLIRITEQAKNNKKYTNS